MGWFSKKVSRDSWGEISVNISRMLEEGRERFFRACIRAVQRSEEEVVCESLGGSGDFALKGYQLGLVSAFLGLKGYIDERHAQEFVTPLYAHVCGSHVDECLEYLNRYYVEDGDGTMKLVGDVIRYVTNREEVDAAIAISLLPSELLLSGDAQIVVATCFGDEKVAEELMAGLERASRKFSEYVRDLGDQST